MRGLRNNNPLNIRRSTDRWDGMAETQTDKDFVQFQSMAYGYRAAWRILNTYYKKLKERKKHFTVENIIHRWAPPTENDTKAYIRTVLTLTSIGGKETLHSEQTLPESAYPSQITVEGEESLKLTFEKGEIAAVNGEKFEDKVEAIRRIEEIGAKYGIGRDMHIGDTIIGIKGRVGFEAAAPMMIIAAHKMLEKHTLTKWQQYWKDQIGTWYGMFLHEAQYLEPVMRDMEAFLDSTQQNVTGTVELTLRPYCYTLVGVESSFDLMKTDFGEYGEVNKAWSADDVKGFTKILGNQIKIYHNVQKRNK